jgi:hypothetical protein
MERFWPNSDPRENYPYLAQWEFGSGMLDREEAEEEEGLGLAHWRLSSPPLVRCFMFFLYFSLI